MSETFWTEDVVENLARKATTGVMISSGLGDYRRGETMIDDLVLISKSIKDRVPRDPNFGNVDTTVIIGKGRSRKPLKLSMPFLISPLRFPHIGKNAHIALARAGLNVGAGVGVQPHILKDINQEGRKKLGKAILQFPKDREGIDFDALDMADAIEIDLTNITKGIMPNNHLDISHPKDIKKIIGMLRETTEYRIPILVRIQALDVPNDIKHLVEAEADGLIIDRNQESAILRPKVLARGFGLAQPVAVSMAHKALVKMKGEEKGISIISSGGVRDGMDAIKYLALGSGALDMTIPPLVALGCTLCGECANNKCPEGIATTDAGAMDKLDIDDGTIKVGNLLIAMNNEIRHLLGLMGVEKLRELNNEYLRSTDYSTAATTGIKLAGFDEVLPFLGI